MPFLWEEATLRAVRSRLLAGTVVPCYIREDRDVGRTMFWEQRYWLDALGVQDKVGFRKQEHRRGLWQRLQDEFDLEPWDFSRSSEAERAVGTVVLSTRGLIGWLLLKRSQTDTHANIQLCLRYVRCLEGVRDAVDSAAAALPEDGLPELALQGMNFKVAPNSTVDLGPLVGVLPTLPDDWDELRARGEGVPLAPFPADARVKIYHLLVFLDCRIRATPPGQAAPGWLRVARHAIIQIIAFLVEVDTIHVLEADAAAERRLVPVPMTGKLRVRSVHRSVLPRLKLLRGLQATQGSSEAVARAITDGVHGVSAEQRSVRNAVYTDQARQACQGAVASRWAGTAPPTAPRTSPWALPCRSIPPPLCTSSRSSPPYLESRHRST